MPLTDFQRKVVKLLAINRTEDSYLAGGAALHLVPDSLRYSNDLDYFSDSEERVASAFRDDAKILQDNSFIVLTDMAQPGYIRATVEQGNNRTKVEWAHDSSWRFMPTIFNEACGYQLHPVDLALNKVLALVGRTEARDLLDVLYAHDTILSLGAMVWAAAGKDPGFTPRSLLELLKRRGKYREEDFSRLHLAKPVVLSQLKATWMAALEQAEQFVASRPSDELGCLYYLPETKEFITPNAGDQYQIHWGRPGGILPALYMGDTLAELALAKLVSGGK